MEAHLHSKGKYFADLSFPLKTIQHQQYLSGKHCHDFYELVIVLNGSGLHVVQDMKYPIFRGDVFVIRPFLEHGYEASHRLQIENILFIPEKLNIPPYDVRNIPGYFALLDIEPALREKHEFKSRLTLDSEQLSTVEQIIVKLNDELREGLDGFRFMAASYFMQLIGYLSRCYSNSQQKHSRKLLKISAMLDFIEAKFCNDISLRDIAGKGMMSTRTANRMFNEALEISPVNYLLKVRIGNARILLKNEGCTVSEAAFRCGFNDSNYFAKQFKKLIGHSPSQYKRKTAAISEKRSIAG